MAAKSYYRSHVHPHPSPILPPSPATSTYPASQAPSGPSCEFSMRPEVGHDGRKIVLFPRHSTYVPDPPSVRETVRTQAPNSASLPPSVPHPSSVPGSHNVSCVSSSVSVSLSVPFSISPSVHFSVPERRQLTFPVPRNPNATESRPRWPQSYFISPITPPARISNPSDGSRIEETSGEEPTNPRRVAALPLRFRPRKPPDRPRRSALKVHNAVDSRPSSSPTILVPIPVSPLVHVPASVISADLSVASQHCSLPSFKRNQKPAAITAKRSSWCSLARRTSMRVSALSVFSLGVIPYPVPAYPYILANKGLTALFRSDIASSRVLAQLERYPCCSRTPFRYPRSISRCQHPFPLNSDGRVTRIKTPPDGSALDRGEPRRTVPDATASKAQMRIPLRRSDRLAKTYRVLDSSFQASTRATNDPPPSQASTSPTTTYTATAGSRKAVFKVLRVQADLRPRHGSTDDPQFVGRPGASFRFGNGEQERKPRLRRLCHMRADVRVALEDRRRLPCKSDSDSAIRVRAPAAPVELCDTILYAQQQLQQPATATTCKASAYRQRSAPGRLRMSHVVQAPASAGMGAAAAIRVDRQQSVTCVSKEHAPWTTLRVNGSVYRYRGTVREGKQCGSLRVTPSTATSTSASFGQSATCVQTFAARLEVDNRFENGTHKEVPKCKWSSDGATCARTPAAHSYLGDSIYGTRGDVYSTRNIRVSTAPTAPGSRGPERLAQRFRTVSGINSGVFSPADAYATSATLRYRESTTRRGSPSASVPVIVATRLGGKDDPGYRLRRVQLPRGVRIGCAAAQDMRSGSVMSGKSRTKTSTSTAVAAETSRGPSRLRKGFSTTPGINSSTSKFRKYMRGKSEPTSQGTAFAK
ncbi:hypothetical protein EDB85DRAFT_2162215 [Lactarius pseudohatsudake]|nr:hypothetical protein EDB85DRAFT_2162215 [Lactarius pseudohatsudake]